MSVPLPPVKPVPAIVVPAGVPTKVGPHGERVPAAASFNQTVTVGSPVITPGGSSPAGLDLESALVPDLVRSLCMVAGHTRYVLSPDVVDLGKRLTVELAGDPQQVWRDGLTALNLAGVDAKCVHGLCQFFVPQPKPEEKKEVPVGVFTYSPRYRDVAFLASSLSGMFAGWHFAGSSSAAGSASASVAAAVTPSSGSGGGGGVSAGSSGHATPQEAVPVRLVGLGPVPDRGKVLAALAQIDQPVPSLVVRVAVYEVDVSKQDESAVAVVGKILGQTVQIGGSVATSLASSGLAGLTLSSGGFSAVAQALDSSSLVHTVTKPVLRTSSGVLASFAVGDSVPTLGSVSYAGSSSTPVQSVVYQQSGVEFSVVPVVVGDKVDVALYQSISSFAATTVGVTTSPTLQNRVLSSDVIVKPGAVVVLGGLMQNADTKGTSGWWIFPRLSDSHQVSNEEMVLVLSVDAE